MTLRLICKSHEPSKRLPEIPNSDCAEENAMKELLRIIKSKLKFKVKVMLLLVRWIGTND